MAKTKGEPGGRFIPLSALLVSILLLIAAYQPLLVTITNPQLQFRYGDFTTIFGEDSGKLRAEAIFSTFMGGRFNFYENRLFTLGMFSALSEYFSFSDSQFHAALILLSMLLGCLGIYFMVMRFEKRPYFQAGMILLLCIFYFLNFWAVDRLAHTWIWFTYAVFPLFLFLGLEAAAGSRRSMVLYSLVFGFFGFLPHSFLYLGMIHGVLVLYYIMTGAKLKEVMVLALVPAVIYIGISMPALVLFPYMDQGYPASLEKVSPEALSKNGDLVNLLAFSNQWWPQLGPEATLKNLPFRYSGICFLLLVFVILVITVDRMEWKKKSLVLLSAIAILSFMFLAQGTNNQILDKAIGWLKGNGLSEVIGVFREWARISIMIPVFACLVIAAGISEMKGAECRAFTAALFILFAVNLAFSPSWGYMQLFKGKVQHPDNFAIKGIVNVDHKVIFLEGIETVQNFFRFPQYPPRNDAGRKAEHEELTDRLLDVYNFGYVIKDGNAEGLGPQAYEWLDCTELETAEICENSEGAETMRVFSGAIPARNQSRYGDSLLLESGSRLAVAQENYSSPYIIGAGAPGSSQTQIFIIEGETDLRVPRNKTVARLRSNSFSGGGALKLSKGVIGTVRLNSSKYGSFTIAFKGNGTILMNFSGTVVNATAGGDGGFGYAGPVSLPKGETLVQVGSESGALIDSIWIYEGNRTVPELVHPAADATLLSWKKADSATWNAEIQSESPFILSMAEPYSRLFEAKVTDESGQVTKVRPVEIMDGINGFPINQTGKIGVEIKFIPQGVYAPAFVSTGLTVLSCLALLAWWRK